jgi:hypothetical protein
MAYYSEQKGGSVGDSLTQIAKASRTSDVEAAMAALAEEVGRAEAQFERLADKLRPVRMTPPPGCGSEGAGRPSSCELVERLHAMEGRLSALNTLMDNVTDQVCL